MLTFAIPSNGVRARTSGEEFAIWRPFDTDRFDECDDDDGKGAWQIADLKTRVDVATGVYGESGERTDETDGTTFKFGDIGEVDASTVKTIARL